MLARVMRAVFEAVLPAPPLSTITAPPRPPTEQPHPDADKRCPACHDGAPLDHLDPDSGRYDCRP
jgi:hypothetical protein